MAQLESILETKLDRYESKFAKHNFVAETELTVTITLDEYRELIGANATRQKAIDEANADKYARENKIKEQEKVINDLKLELAGLKAELYELTKTSCEPKEECAPKFVEDYEE